jgi:hypothetical protein
MTELQRALAEISEIRGAIAEVNDFRGYGPVSVAASGVLALAVASAQAHWTMRFAADPRTYFAVWIGVAALAASMTSLETFKRTRRVHADLAVPMMLRALEPFAPALIAGALLTAVLFRFAPQALWLLPGLWQIVFSLGVFASRRFLPRQMTIVGLWYLGAGLVSIAACSGGAVCSPWVMGVPFGVGQLLVAAILRYGFREQS